jgi:hypothetical protein
MSLLLLSGRFYAVAVLGKMEAKEWFDLKQKGG